MRNFRLTPLGSTITTASLAIATGTSILLYVWVVQIAGHSEAARPIVIGGLIATLVALAVGLYFARIVAARVRAIDEAARKVADGDFATTLPVDYSGQLGQLARTFNEMQRRLAELDQARKRFVANASHELRTPIFSLGGFVELLEEEDPSPEERAEFMRTMREQIQRLTKLTTDLLDLSQLDAGGVELDYRNVDLSSLARDVAREFGPRADRRGSRLELRTPARRVTAFADPNRARQIVRILLDNALTHTPQGAGVTVTTYYVNQRAQLTVSDDGEGIPPAVQKRIFERFYTATRSGGSGLGLAIAQELAQRMNGRMAISSSRRFTAFTLDLPPARPAAVAEAERRPAAARAGAPAAIGAATASGARAGLKA
jgi:two-component system, OmpR family, sensor kinase